MPVSRMNIFISGFIFSERIDGQMDELLETIRQYCFLIIGYGTYVIHHCKRRLL